VDPREDLQRPKLWRAAASSRVTEVRRRPIVGSFDSGRIATTRNSRNISRERGLGVPTRGWSNPSGPL